MTELRPLDDVLTAASITVRWSLDLGEMRDVYRLMQQHGVEALVGLAIRRTVPGESRKRPATDSRSGPASTARRARRLRRQPRRRPGPAERTVRKAPHERAADHRLVGVRRNARLVGDPRRSARPRPTAVPCPTGRRIHQVRRGNHPVRPTLLAHPPRHWPPLRGKDRRPPQPAAVITP